MQNSQTRSDRNSPLAVAVRVPVFIEKIPGKGTNSHTPPTLVRGAPATFFTEGALRPTVSIGVRESIISPCSFATIMPQDAVACIIIRCYGIPVPVASTNAFPEPLTEARFSSFQGQQTPAMATACSHLCHSAILTRADELSSNRNAVCAVEIFQPLGGKEPDLTKLVSPIE